MPERERGRSAYFIAFVAALVAAVAHWLIFPIAGTRIPFVFFVVVIAYAAVFLGTMPALLVVAVGAVNAWFQFRLFDGPSLASGDLMALAVVASTSIVIAVGGGHVRRRLRLLRARSDSHRAERDLEAAERARDADQSRQVLDQSPLPFALLDPLYDEAGELVDFRWTYANPAAFALVRPAPGTEPGQLVSQCVPNIWEVENLFSRLQEVVTERSVRRFEVRVLSANRYRWFSIMASPNHAAVAVWFEDVTDARRRDERRREAERKKDQFIATLAHELRNPLAPIKQAAVLLENESVGQEMKRWAADVIDRQVTVMSRLLEDLLDTSRIALGKLRLRKQDVELAHVIDIAVQTVKPLMTARQHQLSVRVLTPQKWLHVDPVRISQIVSNLLTNAAKYTPTGGKIDLYVESDEGGLTLSVCDNGIGIEPDQLDEIFSLYRQVHTEHGETRFGLGLGLTIVRGLVELHGGTVRATSRGRGHGAKFVVHLPQETLALPPVAEPVIQAHHRELSKRVLIVDDNRDAADTLGMVLSTMGHRVDVAYDGSSGVKKWLESRPDVTILDIGMPGMSGHEVARTIRASPSGGRTKLIAVTGWGQPLDRATSEEAGFNAHLTKPVDMRQLLEELQ